MMRSILLGLALVLATTPGRAEIEGVWSGDLDVAGTTLRLVLHLEADGDGGWSAALDSPDQGAFGIAASAAAVDGPAVAVEFAAMGARLEGVVEADRMEAAWRQGGTAYPLTLTRGEAAGPARPQLPEPPFPYRSEDVTFRNEEAGIELAGTFTVPAGEGPFPAVALLSGSGPQDRDQTVFGHRPFLVLADHLTRAGVAVLRFDDRGVGASGGTLDGVTSPDLAGDAAAAAAWLRARPETDPDRIGLVGHSEGGLTGPLAAASGDGVAFLVLMAGQAVPGREILLAQNRFLLESDPLGAGVVDDVLPWIGRLYDAPVDSVETVLKQARTALGETTAGLAGLGPATHARTVAVLTSPWYRWFLTFDPAPVLAALDIPVLALFGAKDFQVPPALNAAPMRAALRHPQSRVEILPDLNHLFQPAATGAMSEYARIETTLSPALLHAVTDFILHR